MLDGSGTPRPFDEASAGDRAGGDHREPTVVQARARRDANLEGILGDSRGDALRPFDEDGCLAGIAKLEVPGAVEFILAGQTEEVAMEEWQAPLVAVATSTEGTPTPSATPRANSVLPAPSCPRRATKSAGCNRRPSAAPSSRVFSAECVVKDTLIGSIAPTTT